MSRFAVQLTRAAVRDLGELRPSDRDQVVQDLRTLEDAPIGPPPKIKRLRGQSFPLYRLRSGDYRMLYRVDGPTVTVMRVIARSELGRAVRRLKRPAS